MDTSPRLYKVTHESTDEKSPATAEIRIREDDLLGEHGVVLFNDARLVSLEPGDQEYDTVIRHERQLQV